MAGLPDDDARRAEIEATLRNGESTNFLFISSETSLTADVVAHNTTEWEGKLAQAMERVTDETFTDMTEPFIDIENALDELGAILRNVTEDASAVSDKTEQRRLRGVLRKRYLGLLNSLHGFREWCEDSVFAARLRQEELFALPVWLSADDEDFEGRARRERRRTRRSCGAGERTGWRPCWQAVLNSTL